jgi:hypothetical protein
VTSPLPNLISFHQVFLFFFQLSFLLPNLADPATPSILNRLFFRVPLQLEDNKNERKKKKKKKKKKKTRLRAAAEREAKASLQSVSQAVS